MMLPQYHKSPAHMFEERSRFSWIYDPLSSMMMGHRRHSALPCFIHGISYYITAPCFGSSMLNQAGFGYGTHGDVTHTSEQPIPSYRVSSNRAPKATVWDILELMGRVNM